MRLNDEAKLNLKLLLSRERAREKKKYKNKKKPKRRENLHGIVALTDLWLAFSYYVKI